MAGASTSRRAHQGTDSRAEVLVDARQSASQSRANVSPPHPDLPRVVRPRGSTFPPRLRLSHRFLECVSQIYCETAPSRSVQPEAVAPVNDRGVRLWASHARQRALSKSPAESLRNLAQIEPTKTAPDPTFPQVRGHFRSTSRFKCRSRARTRAGADATAPARSLWCACSQSRFR